MRSKLIGLQPSGRGFVVAFDMDDDVLDRLNEFLASEAVGAAKLYGIGGFRRATVGYYDMDRKRYLPIEVDDQVEVLSFIGNVASYGGKPRLHAHCVLGYRDGRSVGGHLLAATVRPTLELMVEEIAGGLTRIDHPDIGIPLLAP